MKYHERNAKVLLHPAGTLFQNSVEGISETISGNEFQFEIVRLKIIGLFL